MQTAFNEEDDIVYYLRLSENIRYLQRVLFITLFDFHYVLVEHDCLSGGIVVHNSFSEPSNDASSASPALDACIAEQIFFLSFLRGTTRPQHAVSIVN